MVTVKELHEALEVLLALGHGDLGVAMTRTRRVDIAGCAVVLDGSSTYVELGKPPSGAKVIMEP
jgi:hypothetical protein